MSTEQVQGREQRMEAAQRAARIAVKDAVEVDLKAILGKELWFEEKVGSYCRTHTTSGLQIGVERSHVYAVQYSC
jgi:hypothetical protein